jgi:hypothetical protein
MRLELDAQRTPYSLHILVIRRPYFPDVVAASYNRWHRLVFSGEGDLVRQPSKSKLAEKGLEGWR